MKNIIIYVCLLSSLIFVGCTCTKSYDDGVKFTDNWSREYSEIKKPELYKPQLEKMVKYFEYPEYSQKNNRFIYLKASMLMMTYCRLFLIKQQIGDEAQADIYFQKAKYWSIIRCEFASTDATSKDIDKGVERFTKENVRKWITRLDPVFINRIDNMARQALNRK